MIFLIAILILLSCYVANSTMEDNSKTAYFVFVGVIVSLVVVFEILFSA